MLTGSGGDIVESLILVTCVKWSGVVDARGGARGAGGRRGEGGWDGTGRGGAGVRSHQGA